MLTKSNGNSIEATYNKDEIIIDSRIVLRNSSGTQMMDEWDGIGGKNLNKIKAYAESENSKYSQSDGLLGSTPYNQLTLEQFLSEYDDSSGSEDAKKAAKDVLPFVKEFLERNPALKDKKLTEIAALWS